MPQVSDVDLLGNSYYTEELSRWVHKDGITVIPA